MSLASILNIARSALLTHQRALDVTAHNIANASTPGYSRQRLVLQAAEPLRMPQGMVGRGVTSEQIQRARSQFLDSAYREESGLLGQFGTAKELLTQVEGIFGEPDDNGLAAGLDQLWDAFSDLANDPSSATARGLVRQNAIAVTQRFNRMDQRLTEVGDDAVARLTSVVSDVNAIADQIADLNRQIVSRGRAGGAPDLEDRRDLLIDQLGDLMQVRVVPHDDGSVGVLAGTVLLVDGGGTQALAACALPNGGWGVGYAAGTDTFEIGSGKLKGLTDFTGTTLPGIRSQLDRLAQSVTSEVNALHRQGITPGGLTNTDFFDPAPPGGVTAGTIRLAAAIADPSTGPSAIAAGTYNAGSPAYLPGDGSIALRIAGLRTTGAASLSGSTLGEFYNGLVSSVGVSTRAAEQSAASQETMVAHVQTLRSSESDVSVDEEMTNMIRQQQAFAAAARIVTVANDMMNDVLRMI